jgi:hypothetical protein
MPIFIRRGTKPPDFFSSSFSSAIAMSSYCDAKPVY